MSMYRNGEKVTKHIRNRDLFKIGNVSGEWFSQDRPPRWGRLEENDPIRTHITVLLKDRDVYVVHSYLTPIAYAWDRTVHVPDVKYSATTTDHQSIARRANR